MALDGAPHSGAVAVPLRAQREAAAQALASAKVADPAVFQFQAEAEERVALLSKPKVQSKAGSMFSKAVGGVQKQKVREEGREEAQAEAAEAAAEAAAKAAEAAA